MNADEIDGLLEKMLAVDIDGVLGYIGKKSYEYSQEELENEDSIILKELIKKIEDGDFNYFLNRIKEKKYSRFVVMLLSHTSRKEEVKKLIENRHELELSRYDVEKLIISLNDFEFIRQFLEDDNLFDEFKGEYGAITHFIVATQNDEYIKYILDNENIRRRYISYINIPEILKAINDQEYLKDIIESREKRIELEIGPINLFDIFRKIDDSKYLEEILENPERQKELELSLGNEGKLYILNAIKDPNYLKEVLENKEKQEQLNIEFSQKDTIFLINSINDAEYTESIIESVEKQKQLDLDLGREEIINLIKTTNDKRYIKNILENPEVYKKLGLEQIDVFALLYTIKDINYIMNYLEMHLPEWTEKIDTVNKNVIKIPPEMTIGLEIESEGRNSELISFLSHLIHPGWKCKR